MTQRTPTPAPQTGAGQIGMHTQAMFDDQSHDPYQRARKYSEPTRCDGCGAVYHGGRWQWGDAPAGAHAETCPACRRIHDKLPAGVLVLDGPYVATHGDELIAIARNMAERERPEHALNRIMQIEAHGDRIEISTTDIHLPQRIGKALTNAHDGELDVKYAKDEYSVRLHWHR